MIAHWPWMLRAQGQATRGWAGGGGGRGEGGDVAGGGARARARRVSEQAVERCARRVSSAALLRPPACGRLGCRLGCSRPDSSTPQPATSARAIERARGCATCSSASLRANRSGPAPLDGGFAVGPPRCRCSRARASRTDGRMRDTPLASFSGLPSAALPCLTRLCPSRLEGTCLTGRLEPGGTRRPASEARPTHPASPSTTTDPLAPAPHRPHPPTPSARGPPLCAY